MTPAAFHERIIRPGLISLQSLGGPRESAQAARFLLAVALQESRLEWRYQIGKDDMRPGPARGWWQFEAGGGVAGVMSHKASAALCSAMCDRYEIKHNRAAIWRAMEGHDMLAVGMARLLLLTDPYAIPSTEAGAWTCYAHRLWRPGRPHPATWPGYWHTASEVCGLPA
jgi:hypothetical protein